MFKYLKNFETSNCYFGDLRGIPKDLWKIVQKYAANKIPTHAAIPLDVKIDDFLGKSLYPTTIINGTTRKTSPKIPNFESFDTVLELQTPELYNSEDLVGRLGRAMTWDADWFQMFVVVYCKRNIIGLIFPKFKIKNNQLQNDDEWYPIYYISLLRLWPMVEWGVWFGHESANKYQSLDEQTTLHDLNDYCYELKTLKKDWNLFLSVEHVLAVECDYWKY